MNQQIWTAVDAYFTGALIANDPAREAAVTHSAEAELPPHQVAANQGMLLMLMAQMNGAKRILEIGTLGGYSTIWLARALPADGQIITLEINAAYAAVAETNFAEAGVGEQIEVRVGPALDSLTALQAEQSPAFDFVFIDADKQNNPAYFRAALELSRPGTVIIIDNVVRDGAVIDDNSSDPRVHGVQELTKLLANTPQIQATALQTVGEKGYDGFILAVVQAV